MISFYKETISPLLLLDYEANHNYHDNFKIFFNFFQVFSFKKMFTQSFPCEKLSLSEYRSDKILFRVKRDIFNPFTLPSLTRQNA